MPKYVYKFLSIFLFYLSSSPSFAFSSADQQIIALLSTAPPNNLTQRIEYFSAAFLNKPYMIEPLGEGPHGEFNQKPLYRLDGFDCQTYVETVLALSLAHNLSEFKSLIIKIRYADDDIAFNKRNHFPSADWLPNNLKKGFIQDITNQIASKDNIAIAHAYINKQQWYQHLTEERIKLPDLNATQLENKLNQLHALGQQATNTWASVNYIPREKFIKNGKPNEELLAKIPNGTIILIVNHAIPVNKLGTQMNITHMGFAIWRNNQLYFRAASTKLKSITELSLSSYIREHPWIKGISIWRPLS